MPMLSHSRPLFCRVIELKNVTPDIRVVRLKVIKGGPFRFAAGQYASVTFEEQSPRDYSMANRPDDPTLEFHVRHASSGGASAYVARKLRIGDGVWVEGPFGNAWLRKDHIGPILAMAGGSGLAPVKSIVETALCAGMKQSICLYFGARNEPDIYLEEHFVALARRHPNFRFIPVLSEPSQPARRRTGTVVEAVSADFASFSNVKAYLAGPPQMVEAAVDMLMERGINADNIHADPFYSQRDKQNAGRPSVPVR